MRKPANETMWMNFITHFRQAYQELCNTYTKINKLVLQERVDAPGNIIPPPPPAAMPVLVPPPPASLILVPPPVPIPQANAVLPYFDQNTSLMQTMMKNMHMIHNNMYRNHFPPGSTS